MKYRVLCINLVLLILLSGFSGINADSYTTEVAEEAVPQADKIPLSQIPAYSGQAYVIIENNQPGFTEDEITGVSFEQYTELDSLGRCGVAFANIGVDIMPVDERGEIGQIKPSGWHTVKYDCVDGNYLYNRCHLIAYQLAGENANVKNLITGTRYLNIEGMLPFENKVAEYVKTTNNHVLYRVTPIYEGNNLVASGVRMEGYSVEDQGAGICYHIYAYNVQPGVTIDYATGDSVLSENGISADTSTLTGATSVTSTQGSVDTSVIATSDGNYVLNTNTMKFHEPSCSSADDIKLKNRKDYTGSRDTLISEGYVPCKRCNP